VPLLVLAVAAPIALLERRSAELAPSRRPRDAGRIATKGLGAACGAGLVGLAWACFPEYALPAWWGGAQDGWFGAWWRAVARYGPWLAALGAAHLAWIDAWLPEPRDAQWHLGAWALRRADADRAQAALALRTWALIGFFLPVLYVYSAGNLGGLLGAVAATRDTRFEYGFEIGYQSLLLFDTVFGVAGALALSRAIGAHARSVDATSAGWLTTILFFPPFYPVLADHYLAFGSKLRWGAWLADTPALKAAWGSVILAALAVTAVSTASFGLRFSAVTHRGLLTRGLYGLTKHPGYVSVVVSMFFVTTPFLSDGSPRAVAEHLAAFAVFVWLYWQRARAEERHLSADPEYVRYALAMNERSVFAPVGRWLPFLRYRPPATRAQGDDAAPALK
jgi:protein-S-isoprenylcysteine O-methyltransferase Ste14